MAWKMRASVFVGVCFAHTLATTAALGAQTSCFEYPCIEAVAFDAVRAALIFPLFYTPWVDFPAQDIEYVRDARLFGWFWLNAAASFTLAVAAWVGGRHVCAWWVSRRTLKNVG